MTAAVDIPFDPRSLGCKCDECPLNDRVPVPPEIRPGRPLILGEAPGGEETERGEPFVGRAGRETMWTLSLHGKKREDFSWGNVLLCQPPGTNLKRFTARLSRRNKQRKRNKQDKIPHPLKCCWPQVEYSLRHASALLPVGAPALTTLRDHYPIWLRKPEGDDPGLRETRGRGDKGLARLRGFPVWLEVPGTKLRVVGEETERETPSRFIPTVATYHPAYVLRKRRWTHTFRWDVGKLLRFSIGRLQWSEPEIIFDPSPAELASALTRLSGTVVGVDVETEGKEPLVSPLRCVGLGNAEFAVVAGFKSVEKPPRKWRCPPETARRLIASFFRNARATGTLLTGNNENIFDRIKLAVEKMPLPDFKDTPDVMLMHGVTDPEVPHSLDFMLSRYTDSPKHKDVKKDKKGKKDHIHGWKDDPELHEYNGKDCVGSARLAPVFIRKLHEVDQVRVYNNDVRLQRLCVGMHVAGLQIDPAERQRHYDRLKIAREIARAKAIEICGRDINLDSPDQIRDLLFDDWALPPTSVETDGGEPSTNKAALYELELRALEPRHHAFIDALFGFRRAKKGFEYVRDLVIWSDGRVRSHFAAHVTPVGRITSSEPNVLNVADRKHDPDSLRSIFIARPGCVLVGADEGQLHLRIIAVLAGVEKWIRIFNADPNLAKQDKRWDLHCVNAGMFFGKDPREIAKYERDFAKTLIYLLVYRGGVKKAWQLMLQVRNPKTGKRPYSGLKLREVRAMRNRLLEEIPELEKWWDRTLQTRRETGEIRDPVLGRRHTLLDSVDGEEEASQIINAPVLMTEGAIMGGEGISGEVMDEIGWEFEGKGYGGPGVVHQNYDSLFLDVAASRAEEAAAVLKRIMNRKLMGIVDLTSEPKIAPSWSQL